MDPPQTQVEPEANPPDTHQRTHSEPAEQIVTLPLVEFQELVAEAARSVERAKMVAQLEGENQRLVRQIEPPPSAEGVPEAVVDLREPEGLAKKPRWWRHSR